MEYPSSHTSAAIKEWLHGAPKVFQAFGATLMLVDKTKYCKYLEKLRKSPGVTWLGLKVSLVQVCDGPRSWVKHPRPYEDYSLYNFIILFTVFWCRNVQFILCWQIVRLKVESRILFFQCHSHLDNITFLK